MYSGRIFVSNVRSGTVTRLDLDVDLGGVFVKQATQIASGYTSHSDPAALIVGPTGLAYDANADVLYVVSTAVMRFSQSRTPAQQITQMGPGTVIYNDPAHLRGPLGLAFAPNGRLLTSNDDAPSVTSTTPPLYGAHGQAAHGRHSDAVFLAD